MNKGTIEQVGTPEEVYERPASTYVGGFIGSPAMNFLPGQISAAQAGVVLESGTRLDLRHGALRDHDGLLVQVGLRPEQIALAPEGQGQIAARVDFTEELGSGRLYHLLVEDIPMTVLSPEKHALKEGQRVGVTVPPRIMHLFNAETTRRIDLTPALTPQKETV